MSSAQTITWLHLSDLNVCRSTQWDAKPVVESLVTDLTRLQRTQGLRPDVILFSGDLAWGQIPQHPLVDQYRVAASILEQIRNAFSPPVPASRVYIVPGNHDVNCDKVDPAHTKHLAGANLDEITGWINECNVTWQGCMQRLSDFADFLRSYGYTHLLGDPQRIITANVIDLAGGSLGIG